MFITTIIVLLIVLVTLGTVVYGAAEFDGTRVRSGVYLWNIGPIRLWIRDTRIQRSRAYDPRKLWFGPYRIAVLTHKPKVRNRNLNT